MPPESTWSQYPVVAILVLAAGLIALAFYRLWKDLLNWFEKQEAKREAERAAQDLKREEEREKQRVWQAEQDKIRDERWQTFLHIMQEEINAQDGRQSEALKNVSAKIDMLIQVVNTHDVWARARDRV